MSSLSPILQPNLNTPKISLNSTSTVNNNSQKINSPILEKETLNNITSKPKVSNNYKTGNNNTKTHDISFSHDTTPTDINNVTKKAPEDAVLRKLFRNLKKGISKENSLKEKILGRGKLIKENSTVFQNFLKIAVVGTLVLGIAAGILFVVAAVSALSFGLPLFLLFLAGLWLLVGGLLCGGLWADIASNRSDREKLINKLKGQESKTDSLRKEFFTVNSGENSVKQQLEEKIISKKSQEDINLCKNLWYLLFKEEFSESQAPNSPN